MPSSEMRQICSVSSFDPDSLGSNSVDSNSSRGSSEEKQLNDENDVRRRNENDVRHRNETDVRLRKQLNDENDVRRRKQLNDVKIESVASAKMSAWNKSKKIEDELSQLWDTGQVWVSVSLGTSVEIKLNKLLTLKMIINNL